jgi:hypothetical protein
MKLVDFLKSTNKGIKFRIIKDNTSIACFSRSPEKIGFCISSIFTPIGSSTFECTTCNTWFTISSFTNNLEIVTLINITI